MPEIKYRELTLDEIKVVELNLLQQVHDICQEQGCRYSLAYGTLLGAVRHKGFIPWDDDVDIVMPRPDYMKFLAFCNSNKVDFGFAANEINSNYHLPYAKIWDKNTISEDKYYAEKGFRIGANIDIFPVDGLGTSDYKTAWKTVKPYVYRNRVLSAVDWGHYTKSSTHSLIYEPLRLALFIYTRFINADKYAKKYNERLVKYSFDDSELVACIGAVKTQKAIKNKKIYEEYTELPFEGRMFKVISAYDQFLRETYGDYMKLPPISKQVPQHGRRIFVEE